MSHFLGHGHERGNSAAAGQGNYLFRVSHRFPVEVPEGERALERIADTDVLKEIIRDEIGDIAPYRDLKKRIFASGLIGRGGDRIWPRQNALAYLQSEVYILAALEHGYVPVSGFESESTARGGGFTDPDDFKCHLRRMQSIGQFPDMILGIGDGGSAGIGFAPFVYDTACAAGVFYKSVNRNALAHLPFASFFSMSSFTNLAAALPFVTCGPIPSPESPWAPANSSPSIKWSSLTICFLATAWSLMLCR